MRKISEDEKKNFCWLVT